MRVVQFKTLHEQSFRSKRGFFNFIILKKKQFSPRKLMYLSELWKRAPRELFILSRADATREV